MGLFYPSLRNCLAVRRVEDAVRALPSRGRAFVEWEQGDTLEPKQQLGDLADDRRKGSIR